MSSASGCAQRPFRRLFGLPHYPQKYVITRQKPTPPAPPAPAVPLPLLLPPPPPPAPLPPAPPGPLAVALLLPPPPPPAEPGITPERAAPSTPAVCAAPRRRHRTPGGRASQHAQAALAAATLTAASGPSTWAVSSLRGGKVDPNIAARSAGETSRARSAIAPYDGTERALGSRVANCTAAAAASRK
jgi:hypothetical protein